MGSSPGLARPRTRPRRRRPSMRGRARTGTPPSASTRPGLAPALGRMATSSKQRVRTKLAVGADHLDRSVWLGLGFAFCFKLHRDWILSSQWDHPAAHAFARCEDQATLLLAASKILIEDRSYL